MSNKVYQAFTFAQRLLVLGEAIHSALALIGVAILILAMVALFFIVPWLLSAGCVAVGGGPNICGF